MSRRIKFALGTVIALCITFLGCAKVDAATRIHYLALKGSTDAILLEDNGRFGMVDSGEDWDYPQGDDLKYPYRTGIVTDQGFEQQVIYYMKSVGVTASNLDFYIGTHAHSDHIGSGDEIVNYFKPKKLYLKKYSDSNLLSDGTKWDNLYIYNGLLTAARNNKVTVVQNLTEGMQIKLGSQMKLNLYNTEVQKKVSDENANSLVVKVSAYGRTTTLTADMIPKTARSLFSKGSLGATNVLKLPHHGYVQNNPEDILRKFSPDTAVITGPVSNMSSSTRYCLSSMGTIVESTYSTAQAAIVTQFTAAGWTSSVKSVKSGWFTYDGGRYYMDTAGRPAVGWKKISGKWYYFDHSGKAKTGWLKDKGNYYFLKRTDSANYKQGVMLTGWQTIDGKTYYFKKDSGEMLTGFRTIGGSTFYFKQSGGSGIRGQAMTGWQTYQGRTYYFKQTGSKGIIGRMLTGWQTIGGKLYYFKQTGNVGWSKGMLLTGWQTIGGKIYYLKRTGTAGVRGCATTGWLLLDGKTYYFKQTGTAGVKAAMLTGWQTIGGEQFYFLKSGNAGWSRGKLLMGWQSIGGDQYYLEPSGAAGVRGRAVRGFREIEGENYYFRPDGGRGIAGRMVKGTIRTEGDYVYSLHKQTGALFDVKAVLYGAESGECQEQSMVQHNQAADGQEAVTQAAFRLKSEPADGELEYRTFQKHGQEGPVWDAGEDGAWKKDGEISGSEDESDGGIQAIEMRLTGELAKQYDLYYQVYILDYGWLGWAKNGAAAGVNDESTEALTGEIGALRIQLRPKDSGYGAPEGEESPVLGKVFPDRTNLQAVMKEAGTVLGQDELGYTAPTWQALKEASAKAEEVLKNYAHEEQETLDEAAALLEHALKGLLQAPNITMLIQTVELREQEYPDMEETAAKYTAKSWEILNRTYEAAKVVLDNYRSGEYTQDTVDTAEAALIRAMEQLQPAEVLTPEITPPTELPNQEHGTDDQQTEAAETDNKGGNDEK